MMSWMVEIIKNVGWAKRSVPTVQYKTGNHLMYYKLKLCHNLTWLAALACFFTGFYIAIEHTAHFFSVNNYLFSPFADDILDNASWTYPVVLGKREFIRLFDPFGDHRVVIAHLMEIFDFVYTNGLQVAQPYRLSIILWLNFFLFSIFVLLPKKELNPPAKLTLMGAYILLLFPGISINNYVSTMQITWPLILLFSLLAFICAEKYCQQSLKKQSSKLSLFYLFFTAIFVNLTLYTFNIGIILWPIILLLLLKRRCLSKNYIILFSLIIFTYYYYWTCSLLPGALTAHGGAHSSFYAVFPRLLQGFLFFSRLVSVPLINNAIDASSIYTLVIGVISAVLALYLLFYYLFKKTWLGSDSIFFAYFLFNLTTVIIISLTRNVLINRPEVGALVEWRFLTCSLMFLFCLLAGVFFILNSQCQRKKIINAGLSVFSMLWLLFFFLPKESILSNDTYDLGFFNQVYISEATGIPIDNAFLQASGIYMSSGVLAHHLGVIDVQKAYKKGPFSFWPSQYINQDIAKLNLALVNANHAVISPILDYRIKHNPGVLINVLMDSANTQLNTNWSVLFTNAQGKIIGFAIAAPYPHSLWSLLWLNSTTPLLWRGAINSDLLAKDKKITVWAVDKMRQHYAKLGVLALSSEPIIVKAQPDWRWQKTTHFGLY